MFHAVRATPPPRFVRSPFLLAVLICAVALGLRPLCAQTTLTYTNGQTDATAHDTSAPASPLTLTLASGTATQSGVLSGSGSIIKAGDGTLVLAASNTYSGGTTLSAGTLGLGADDALGSGTLTITGGTLRAVDAGRTLTNDVVLAGDFTLGRLTTLAGDITLAQNVTITSANPDSGGSSTSMLGGVISGGYGLTFANGTNPTGAIVLGGANTYTGDTVVLGGTLTLANSLALQNSTLSLQFTADGGATLNFGSLTAATLGGLAGTQAFSLGSSAANAVALTVGGNDASTVHSGFIDGAGSITKVGSGTLTLTGYNTYSGGTTISAGTLQIGNGSTNGTFLNGDVTNNASLVFNLASGLAYQNVISGTGTVTKDGGGALTLWGANTYTGDTLLLGGALKLANTLALQNSTVDVRGGALTFRDSSVLGGLAGTQSVGLADFFGNAIVLTVGNNNASTAYAGVLSGPGSLVKIGTGTLTLSGANTYSGSTTLVAGTLALAGGGTLGSGAVYVTGGATLDLGGTSQTLASLGSTSNRVVGDLTAGTLAVSGNTYLQSGSFAATFTGSSATGRLWIGGDASATVYLNGTNDAVYTVDHNAVIIGYATTGAAGTVKLGNALALAAATEDVELFSGTLDFNGQTGVRAHAIDLQNGSASALINSDTAHATGFDGAVTLVTGSAQIGGAGDLALSGALTGSGGFSKIGAGTLTLSGANTYSGDTAIDAGTLRIGSGATFGSSAVTLASGARLDLAGNAAAFASVAGDGDIALGSGVLTIGSAGTSTALGGVISGSGGLVKVGAGTLTITGANTYTGSTTVSAGTLAIGDGHTSGNVAGDIVDDATLAFNRSDVLAYAGAISGSGSLIKTGAGTLTLSGANTYAGSTTIDAGTLALSGTGTLGSGALYLTGGATLDLGGTTQSIAALGSASARVVGDLTVGTLTVAGDSYLESGSFAATFTGSSASARLYLGGDVAATVYLDGTNDAINTADHNQVVIGQTSITGAAGTVKLGNAHALAAATENVALYSGTLDLNGQTGVRARAIDLQSGSASILLNRDTAHAASFAGTVSLATGSAQIGGDGDLTLSGALTGAGGFTKTGSGTLTLSGAGTFSGATTLASGTLVLGNSLALQSSTLELTGGALSFGSLTGATLGNLSGSQSLALSNASSGAVALTVGGNNASTTYAGVLSGPGALVKAGAGTLTLAGTNTYSGGTTVNAGLIGFTTAANLGSGAIILDGGGLQWTSGGTTDISARLAALGSGGGTFDTAGNDVTFAAALPGTGALTKTGVGTLTLAGANTYNGGTVVEAGLIGFTTAANFGSGAITLNGGGLQWTSGSTTDISARLAALGSAGATFDTHGNDVTLASALSGTGALIKTGDGKLTLTAVNTYTGGTTIAAGTLALAHASALGNGTLTLAGGALANTAALDLGNTVALAANATFDTTDGALTLSGAISGSGALTKIGAGTLTLAAANTYSGGTTIDAGTLALSGSGTLGTGALYLANGATLDLSGTTQNVAGVGDPGNGVVGHITGGTISSTGNVCLRDGTFTNTFTGSSSGYLFIDGEATTTVVLDGRNDAVNPYDTTQVVIGYFSAGGTTRLGHANALAAATSNVEIYSGTLDLNGQTGVRAKNLLLYGGASSALVNDTTTAGASFAGGVTLANNATHLGGAGQLTLSGILSGSGGVTKTGAGTLTLAGTNTYTGATYVNAGTVVVNGSAANSAFTVNSGATLGGNGTIGALTIARGGILAPGNSPGTLSAGDTTFAGGGTFQFQLNDANGSAGTNWDVLAVNGTLTLSATSANPFTLDLTSLTLADAAGDAANFNASADYSFTFLTTTAGVSGFSSDKFSVDTTHFSNPFTGAWSISLTNSGHDLSINYTASAVPEPSTYTALAGLAALGAAGLRCLRARRS